MIKLRTLFVLIAMVYGADPFAQNYWSYGVNPYYGGVFRYREGMDQLELTNLYGVEVYANKLANGTKDWHKLYNYPQWGVSAGYYNYGVPDELGQVALATTYLDFTAGKSKHKWRINIGTGLVYSDTTFEPVTNESNKAVSSTISYVLRGTIHHEFMLSEHWYVNVNAAFRHFSNGRLNMPNNGMNFPVVGVGVRYQPQQVVLKESPERAIDIRWHYTLRGSISWRQVLEIDEPQNAYALTAYTSKQLTPYNSILLGIDFFRYDKESIIKSNNVYRFKNNIPESHHLSADTDQLALTLGTEILISKATVIIQGGFYIHRPQEYYATWYQRYGLKYNFTEHIFSQFSLKTHSHTADMVEFGVGFSI